MDNFLTNKYFCLAIIIALGIMVYLYNTRDSCSIEGMENVDLSVLAPELTDEPWAREGEDEKYRRVDSKFNKDADETVKRNLEKQGYKYTSFIKGPGALFEEYEKANNNGNRQAISREGETLWGNGGSRSNNNYPKPKDDRPDLAACQPCNCDNNNNTDDDSEDTEEYYRRKLREARRHKKYRR